MFGGVFAIAIAAAFFRSEGEMSALALGLCGGCVVGGILIAPYFRRSGSATPGDFLSARFGSRWLGAIGRPDRRGRAVSDAGRPTVDRRHDRRLDAGHRAARPRSSRAALLLLLPPLLGGMRGVTATALVQFVLALVALVAVSVWMSAVVTGSSLPPVAYATALMAAAERHSRCAGCGARPSGTMPA